MRLLLKNKHIYNYLFGFMSVFFFVNYSFSMELPICPQEIVVENGKVKSDFSWSVNVHKKFIDNKSKAIKFDGVLKTDYKYPIIGLLSEDGGRVSGAYGMTAEMEESESFAMYTWDMAEIIASNEIPIFLCEYHGDRGQERPVRTVNLYKTISPLIKICKLSFKYIDYESVPNSQVLSCK